jgi:L-cysteine:1D-myo-inositol 2-amino-2-deoxy-alpha-D-glucopyranoside ligase
MRLFDTLRGEVAELAIPTDRPLTMYVCGVTPYDTTHIGHARTFLVFDLLQRYLRSQGATVRYCQNVTDVDDPLFERANRDGVDWRELARTQTEQFVRDCAALNMLPPDYFPKASDEIPYMIPIIEALLAKGYAYARNGSVYFRVRSDPDYGAMARMPYAELLATANERGNNPDDPNKEDPLDFALWTAARPGEPAWESPWGMGRPGWHIECTTMAMHYLGPQIDIHGGGRDLIFPHHPSEIAQSEHYTGKRPFVRFWVHAGLAWLNGEKMSKSRGNMVFVRDALREHSADALRWYLLSFPYREDFTYERAGVVAAEEKVERLRLALRPGRGDSPQGAGRGAAGGTGRALDPAGPRAAFFAALDSDLQAGHALEQLDLLAREVLLADAVGADVRPAQAALREMAGVFGFRAGS